MRPLKSFMAVYVQLNSMISSTVSWQQEEVTPSMIAQRRIVVVVAVVVLVVVAVVVVVKRIIRERETEASGNEVSVGSTQ